MFKEPLMRRQQKLPVVAPGVNIKSSRRGRRARIVCMRLFMLIGGLTLAAVLMMMGMNTLMSDKQGKGTGANYTERVSSSGNRGQGGMASRWKEGARIGQESNASTRSNDKRAEGMKKVASRNKSRETQQQQQELRDTGEEGVGTDDLQKENTGTKVLGKSLYDSELVVKDGVGQDFPLSALKGKVTLIVNVASQCGYTDSNYKGLTELYDKYAPYGFEILAFPCNSFGSQEPWDTDKVQDFVRDKYNAIFPIMAKLDVDVNEHPLFVWLQKHAPGDSEGSKGPITWNFNKFLISKDGRVARRYDMAFDVARMEEDVYELLLEGSDAIE